MKGAIFIALNEMIEQTHGINFWEELLDKVNPESGGIYTSTQDYPEQEAIDFIHAISEKTKIPIDEIQKIFGTYLFTILNGKYPVFSSLTDDFFEFLDSIHGVIHKEVRKLYTQPGLPEIHCTKHHDKFMTMTYKSPRKMCFLAEGLVQGAAIHYNHTITIDHKECMHQGFDHCSFDIAITGSTERN